MLWLYLRIYYLLVRQDDSCSSSLKAFQSCMRAVVGGPDPGRQNVAQRLMLDQIKTDVEAPGMDLCNICDFEHRLEADAFLADVAHLVLLCGLAHITQGLHIPLRKADLHMHSHFSSDKALGPAIKPCTYHAGGS